MIVKKTILSKQKFYLWMWTAIDPITNKIIVNSKKPSVEEENYVGYKVLDEEESRPFTLAIYQDRYNNYILQWTDGDDAYKFYASKSLDEVLEVYHIITYTFYEFDHKFWFAFYEFKSDYFEAIKKYLKR